MFDIIKRKDLEPYASGARWYRFRMPGYLGGAAPRIVGDMPVLEEVHNDQLPDAPFKGPLAYFQNNSDIVLSIGNFLALEMKYLPDLDSVLASDTYTFAPSNAPAQIDFVSNYGTKISNITGWSNPYPGGDTTWYIYVYGIVLDGECDPGEF